MSDGPGKTKPPTATWGEWIQFDALCSTCSGTKWTPRGEDEHLPCLDCYCTGRDTIPWSELFIRGRPWE